MQVDTDSSINKNFSLPVIKRFDPANHSYNLGYYHPGISEIPL